MITVEMARTARVENGDTWEGYEPTGTFICHACRRSWSTKNGTRDARCPHPLVVAGELSDGKHLRQGR